MLWNSLSWLRSVLFTIPIIFLYTIVMGSLSLTGSLFERRGRFQHACARIWSRLILATSFVRVTVEGLEKIDLTKPFVFCSNHLSYMDTPVVFGFLPFQFRIVAKKSLFVIPFMGWHLQRAGHLPGDPNNPREAVRSLAKARDRILQGTSIILFPEGGRSPDGTLQPFLSGSFRLALETRVPVVPMVIVGTRKVLPPDSLNIRSGRVRLIVNDPISTEGMSKKDKDLLAEKVREAIRGMLQKASPR